MYSWGGGALYRVINEVAKSSVECRSNSNNSLLLSAVVSRSFKLQCCVIYMTCLGN